MEGKVVMIWFDGCGEGKLVSHRIHYLRSHYCSTTLQQPEVLVSVVRGGTTLRKCSLSCFTAVRYPGVH